MKRLFNITVLCALLMLPFSLHGQVRSDTRSNAMRPVKWTPNRIASGRVAPVGIRPWSSPFRSRPSHPVRTRSPRSGAAPVTSLRFVSATNPGLAPGYFDGTPCRTNPSYAVSFFCSQFVNDGQADFGAAAFAPIYWIVPMDYSQEEETPPAPAEPDGSVAAQVQDLTDEVEMLREEQSSRQESTPAETEPRTAAAEKPLKTVLVYRDGHQSEVQDYAILGKTLWVFAGQTAKKVPLAALDLDGTIKVNDDRGVDFIPPGAL